MPRFNFYYKKCFHVEKWGWRKPNLKMAIDNIAQQLSDFSLLSKIFPIFTRNEEVASDWDRVCTSRQSESLPDSPPPPHTRTHPWLRLSDGDTPQLSNRKFFSLSCRSSWSCDMGWEVRPGPSVLFSSRAGPWRAAIFLLTYKVIYSPS